MDADRDLVTLKAAALALGVSVRTLQRWIASGQLDAYCQFVRGGF